MAVNHFCSNCGQPIVGDGCLKCGAPQLTAVPPYTGYAGGAPPYAGAASRPGERYIGQWNWGAFLLCPFWLMNHGRIWRGILYLAMSWIPVVNFISLGMAIAYGIRGNQVASANRAFADDAQFVAVQTAWRNWGIGVTIISVFLGIVGSILSVMVNGLPHPA